MDDGFHSTFEISCDSRVIDFITFPKIAFPTLIDGLTLPYLNKSTSFWLRSNISHCDRIIRGTERMTRSSG